MKQQTLLVLTAILEIITGIGLLLAPSLLSKLLLGAGINDPVDFTIARVGGSAILAIGAMCWRARKIQEGVDSTVLTSGLLVYNILVFVVLAYSAFSYKITPLLIAALIVHGALAIFCMNSIQKMNRRN